MEEEKEGQTEVINEENVPEVKPSTTITTTTVTTTKSSVSEVTSNVGDFKVSVSDAAPASAVKVASQDVAKCDAVTTKDVTSASLDRTKLSLKLPPRPEDYDFYWYQDDDGTWRNEYDDQVSLEISRSTLKSF